jgi:thiamine biosynthesis lipoprotein
VNPPPHPTRRTAWLTLAVLGVLAVAALGFWQQRRLHAPPAAPGAGPAGSPPAGHRYAPVRVPGGGLALGGETMGTTWSVRTAAPAAVAPERLQALLEARLRELNASLSTWDPQSELSRINAAPAHTPLPLGADLRTVLAAALELSRATGGAFDPTVGPLVNLWGFGPGGQRAEPDAAAIAAARARTGFAHVRLEDHTLTKEREGLYLDLSAIAKGFGVDALGRVLEAQGVADYVAEIGGEVLARGRAPQGRPWSIGIDAPVAGAAPGERLAGVMRLEPAAAGLERLAVATSGSYRRFRRLRDGTAHHIVDPRTGRPTGGRLVAVSVVAPDCMTADGIATALMVLGVEAGLAWVERRPGVSALFLEAAPEGAAQPLVRHVSRGFPALDPAR